MIDRGVLGTAVAGAAMAVAVPAHPGATAVAPVATAADEGVASRENGGPAGTTPTPFYFPLFGGVEFQIAVDHDLVTNVNVHDVGVLEVHGGVVTLIDSYTSRAAPGTSCAGKRERYVRVLDTNAKVERFARLIESCRHAVIVDEPPVTWAPGNTGFTINYRSEPPLWVPVVPGAAAPDRQG